MNKFESVENCIKCRSNMFSPVGKIFYGKRKYVPATLGTGRDTIVPEHLEVTCSHCGFTWLEECAE